MNNNSFQNAPTADDSNYSMYRCDRNSCMSCSSRICMDNYVKNHVTKESFSLTFNGSCDTKNCVYVIKCTHIGCNYQCVGHNIKALTPLRLGLASTNRPLPGVAVAGF